jgi:hypothetical protein
LSTHKLDLTNKTGKWSKKPGTSFDPAVKSANNPPLSIIGDDFSIA